MSTKDTKFDVLIVIQKKLQVPWNKMELKLLNIDTSALKKATSGA
jgi:hypothetical protein